MKISSITDFYCLVLPPKKALTKKKGVHHKWLSSIKLELSPMSEVYMVGIVKLIGPIKGLPK